MIGEALYKAEKKAVRSLVIEEGKRVDLRGLDEIRPLSAEVGLFERVHGSALFSRGQTQVGQPHREFLFPQKPHALQHLRRFRPF